MLRVSKKSIYAKCAMTIRIRMFILCLSVALLCTALFFLTGDRGKLEFVGW